MGKIELSSPGLLMVLFYLKEGLYPFPTCCCIDFPVFILFSDTALLFGGEFG